MTFFKKYLLYNKHFDILKGEWRLFSQSIAQSIVRVLIVGVKASNFDDAIKKNPRIFFWKTEDVKNKPSLPPVDVVIFTRFLSHAVREKVIEMAQKQGIKFFRHVFGTGEIRRFLLNNGILDLGTRDQDKDSEGSKELIFQNQGKEMAMSDQECETKSFKRGELQVFVEKNFNKDSSSVKEEAKRIYSLALEMGYVPKMSSIQAIIYKLKRGDKQKNNPPPRQSQAINKIEKTVQDFLDSIEVVKMAAEDLLDKLKTLELIEEAFESLKK